MSRRYSKSAAAAAAIKDLSNKYFGLSLCGSLATCLHYYTCLQPCVINTCRRRVNTRDIINRRRRPELEECIVATTTTTGKSD